MINQGNNVPDKTIAIFANEPFFEEEGKKRLSSIFQKAPKKRNWFTPHFYRCLPLVIGNQYGFVIKSEFDFSFLWNGSNDVDAVTFEFYEPLDSLEKKYPRIDTHFGSGIITIHPPFVLRTPPGVNLMTINPPNYIIPNITVMTGVIETDNIRRNFTFNLKIQIPNIKVHIPAGAPLAAVLPIPRYFADSFQLKNAEEIFSDEVIMAENQADVDTNIFRQEIELNLPHRVNRQYFRGEDIYGHKFPDHQKP